MTGVHAGHADDGSIRITARGYCFTLEPGRPRAFIERSDGRPAGVLALLAAVNALGGLDATAALEEPEVNEDSGAIRLTLRASSTAWREKVVTLECLPDALRLTTTVSGDGYLGEVHLLAGWWSGDARRGAAFYRSEWPARTLFSPEPDDPRRVLASARETALISVAGSDMAGRAPWFFTPAPLLFAGTEAMVTDPRDAAAAPWTTIALETSVAEATFTEVAYEPIASGFALRLSYDGQTQVVDRWTSPTVVIRMDEPDPYSALGRHTDALRGAGLAPTPQPTNRPEWWSRPIFCGWGAQCHVAKERGVPAPTLSRRELYDSWLATLEEHGVVPGTIVLDDKWQREYGTNEADAVRWPGLAGWIADRHRRDQRVLLWLKAWDPEGLPADECVRDAAGRPVGADPTSSAYAGRLRAAIRAMLGADGLDADGFKVDFTGSTPAGPGMTRHGAEWGVALLHRLLALIHAAAKQAKPDALIVTHTPHPWFADVSDMIRLNDLLRLSQPEPAADTVAQMTYRAEVARAACPELLVDTDDWCMPSLADWRAYLAVKPDLGVPALYYATHIDHSGEPLTDTDYAAIRDAWSRAEGTAGAG